MANNWEAKSNLNSGYPPSTGYPPSASYYPPGKNMPAIPLEYQAPYPPSSAPYPYPQPNSQIQSMPVVNQPHSIPIPMPIAAQPQLGPSSGWMNVPTQIPNCPPGLEYLATVDQLLVHQMVELLEAFTGFETNNKYEIKNTLGQKIFLAAEDNDCCTRNCCGSSRPFDMKVLDISQREIMHFHRPLACSSCCFPCCLQSLVVSAPLGILIGSIEQEWTLCYPHYSVKNDVGKTVLRIEGPLCTSSCGGDVEFKILSLDGTQVGKISKQWSGLAKEMFTDADNFGISFPMDLDVRMKAVMLGACILIDMMFYETTENDRSHQY